MINIALLLKYRKYLHNNILYQTSYLEHYKSKYIKVNNYVMKKYFNSIFDFNDYYFYLYASKDYIFYDKLIENLIMQNKEIDVSKYDLNLIDFDKVIKVKSIAKDLFLLEIDNAQTLLAKKQSIDNIEELKQYEINEFSKFYELDLSLLSDYSLEDLRNLLGSINNAIALFKMLVEKKKKKKLMKKSVFDYEMLYLDFSKLYLANNVELSKEDRKINSYFCILGSAGSGKTFTLMHYLFNILLSNDYDKVIFFDTQHLFNDYYNMLIDAYRNVLNKMLQKKKLLIINENNIFLSEEDLINAINFVLESNKIISSKEKQATLLNISLSHIKDLNELKSVLQHKYSEIKKKKDFKELYKLEIVKDILNLLYTIQVKDYSFYDLLTKDYILVLQFDNVRMYEILAYLYLNKLYDELKDRDSKETFLFLDETQKYLQSELIQEILIRLMQEKRQYNLKVFYTALTYENVKELIRYTQTLILNDLSDIYLKNIILSITQISNIAKHKEKLIYFKDENKVIVEQFENKLFKV